jgi:hypothetical protein
MQDKEEAMTDDFDFDIGDALDCLDGLSWQAVLVLLVIAGIIGLVWYLT